MKNLLIIVFSFFGICNTFAQKSGVIQYKESKKFEFKMPDNDPKFSEMMKNMPTSFSNYKKTYFTEKESITLVDKTNKDENKVKMGDEENQIKIEFKLPDNKTYKNLDDNLVIKKEELFGKDFLITGSIKVQKWKIEGEQKKILEYTCIKATLIDTTEQVSAWFTPQIPISIGPEEYGGLPGAILALEYKKGKNEKLIAAMSIEPLPADFVITKPTEGKKVSEEEFVKIKAEKMKELKEANGGKGPFIIKTTEH